MLMLQFGNWITCTEVEITQNDAGWQLMPLPEVALARYWKLHVEETFGKAAHVHQAGFYLRSAYELSAYRLPMSCLSNVSRLHLRALLSRLM